jgi:putative glutamine amidotransferase
VATVVGVTSYTPAVTAQRAYALPCDYVDSLRAAGTDVVLLTDGVPDVLLQRLDAVVLSGGGDIEPARYGGDGHDAIYMVDPRRDEFEIAVTRSALAHGVPLLAICRGMQILNVTLGGSLVAHVPDRWGDAVVHRAPPREPIKHEVVVNAGTRLADIVGEGPLEVVSWHHQAIDRVADGLHVVARSCDGVPEAVETLGSGWTIGVQWHPELNARDNPRQAALFRELVRVGRTRTREG